MDNPLLIIFKMVMNFAMLLLFIRFMFQFAGINPRNPYAMPAYKATKIVDVFGRIFKPLGKGQINTAAIVLIFLLRLIDVWGQSLLLHMGINPIQMFFISSVSLVIYFLQACRYLIMGSIILSWVIMLSNSIHPVMEIIMQMAEPILAPFRRIMPNMGMFDLSPILAFFAIIIAEMIIGAINSEIAPMIGL